MAPRTVTNHLNTVSLLSTELTYTSPTSNMVARVPVGAKFDTGLHWHEITSEHFQVHKGVLRVVLENEKGVLEDFYVGTGSGNIDVPVSRRHRLRRGDLGLGKATWSSDLKFIEGGAIPLDLWESEISVEEWTKPADGHKQIFFRNFSGVMGEMKGEESEWKFKDKIWLGVSSLTIMHDFDGYPAMFDGKFTSVERPFVHGVLAAVSWVGRSFGLKSMYDEYTPEELRGLVVDQAKKDV